MGKKKTKRGVVARFFLALLKIFLVLLIVTTSLSVIYRWVNPPITPLMVIRKVTISAPIEKKWVDIEQISPHFVSCAVAAEDNFFLAHRGFDFGAIQSAIDEQKRGGRQRGGSTISQQTAKNVFLWSGHSWVRKGLEVYFTFLIETFWSKERIMEVYLNVIEMGTGIYGCEAASQHYFGKSAADVSRYEAALITAIYPDPLHRNPAHPTKYLSKRGAKIAALSKKFGKISFDDATIERAQKRYEKREKQRIEKNNGKILEF